MDIKKLIRYSILGLIAYFAYLPSQAQQEETGVDPETIAENENCLKMPWA